MLEEIQKRPFARPLLFWISGILIYACCPLRPLFFGVGIILTLSVLFLCLSTTDSYYHKAYDSRWIWGSFCLCATLSLAILVCNFSDWNVRSEKNTVGLLEQKAIKTQTDLVEKFDHLSLSDQEKNVLATLTLGYKKAIHPQTRRLFSMSGVSHVLAVSGFHVGVVCGFLSFFFMLFPVRGYLRWFRYLFLMAGLWFYIFISGLSPSAVRAGLMFTLFQTGKTLRFRTDGYNTLAAAAFCMLAYDPSFLFDLGFQLSFVAVFFILILVPKFNNKLVVKNPILSTPLQWVFLSIAAQIGVSPLCCYYFGQISTIFLLASLPITLFSSLLLPLALLWLLYPLNVWGSELLGYCVEALVWLLMKTVESLSFFPFASLSIHFGITELLGSYLSIFLLICYMKERRFWLLFAALVVVFLLSAKVLIGLF